MKKSDKKFKRKCIACGNYDFPQNMIKITRIQTKELIINPSDDIMGHSAYICSSDDCINSAIKNKKLQKIFRTNIDNSIIEQLSKISV